MKVNRRASNGKLKAAARPKRRRKSEGFSSSFTQKTMNNNTLLAQSLAKEKSRNEKMLSMQRDLIASRNEALMRLNEIETSFERMGMVVQKGIKQLQDIATTMGELYNEIQLFRNNPRDSASMRNSWEEKNCMKKASTNIARMQTVKPMVDGHMITTQPRISLPRIDSQQETTVTREPSPPRCPLLFTSPSVSAIEEESEASNSDEDNDEDEVRNNSLVCRAPRQSPHLETMREFYDRVYAQDPQEGPSRPTKRGPQRLVRKVPRGVTKLPGRNVEVDSSSDDSNVNNITTLCLVDMDETVINDSPVSVTVKATEVKENKQTTLRMIKEIASSPKLSYGKVFNISESAEYQTICENKPTTLKCKVEQLENAHTSNIDNGCSDTRRSASPDSPDFLGFPLEEVPKSFKTKTSTKTKSFSCGKAVSRKSTTLKSKSTSNLLPHVDVVTSQATSPSMGLTDVAKHLEVKLHDVSTCESIGSRTSTVTNRQSVISSNQKLLSSGKESPKLKDTKCSPVSENECTSSVGMKNPTVMLSDINLSKSIPPCINDSSTPNSKKSFANNVSHDTHELSLDTAKTSIVNHNQPFQSEYPALHLEMAHQGDLHLSTIICHRKSGQQMNFLNTPQAGDVIIETKSASECQKVLMIELERLPSVSKSATVQPVTKKHKVIRKPRNTHIEGNENTNHVVSSSKRGQKRNSPIPVELCDTPTRRIKNESPNPIVPVTKLDTSTNSRPSCALEENSEQTGRRRALRRIPQMNYKEPPLSIKLRRPCFPVEQ